MLTSIYSNLSLSCLSLIFGPAWLGTRWFVETSHKGSELKKKKNILHYDNGIMRRRCGNVSNKLCIIGDSTCHTLIDSPHSAAKTPWCVTFNVFHPLGGCTALHCAALGPQITQSVWSSLSHTQSKSKFKSEERESELKPGVLTSGCIFLKDDSRWEGLEQKCGAAPESILASFLHQSPVCRTAAKLFWGLTKLISQATQCAGAADIIGHYSPLSLSDYTFWTL